MKKDTSTIGWKKYIAFGALALLISIPVANAGDRPVAQKPDRQQVHPCPEGQHWCESAQKCIDDGTVGC
ncbi:MAG: hypothetical protein Q8R24_06450 [Legionellaceae bacterium]|nr:hypothetical protein [Legionellaceae bacterium]